MLARIWHGYTSKQNADKYERMLIEEIFPRIENKQIKGLRGIQLIKRETDTEIEFTTIMWFNDIESVKQFAGDDFETAYIPQNALEVLSRYDEKSTHCMLIHDLKYTL